MKEELRVRCQVVMDELLFQRPGNEKLRNLSHKEVLDSADLLVIFQISKTTLWRWRRDKILKGRQIKLKWFYLWVDILPLLEKK